MGPVVDDNWDGVTYTIEPSPIPTSTWHTVYDRSSGYDLRYWINKGWATTGVPCNISNKTTKLRIKYKPVYYDGSREPSGKYVKLV